MVDIRIRGITLALLGGNIFFSGLRYTTKNSSVWVMDGVRHQLTLSNTTYNMRCIYAHFYHTLSLHVCMFDIPHSLSILAHDSLTPLALRTLCFCFNVYIAITILGYLYQMVVEKSCHSNHSIARRL